MIIVNNNSGQLCNKLILFAHAYATAIDTHQKVYHLYWFYSRHLFREPISVFFLADWEYSIAITTNT